MNRAYARHRKSPKSGLENTPAHEYLFVAGLIIFLIFYNSKKEILIKPKMDFFAKKEDAEEIEDKQRRP